MRFIRPTPIEPPSVALSPRALPSSTMAQMQAVQEATAVESLSCVKALLKLSIFQICHLRGLLPEDAFDAARSIAGVDNLRSMKARLSRGRGASSARPNLAPPPSARIRSRELDDPQVARARCVTLRWRLEAEAERPGRPDAPPPRHPGVNDALDKKCLSKMLFTISAARHVPALLPGSLLGAFRSRSRRASSPARSPRRSPHSSLSRLLASSRSPRSPASRVSSRPRSDSPLPEVLEQFEFSFTFSAEGATMQANINGHASTPAEVATPAALKKQACAVLRMLVASIATLNPVPDDRTISMHLIYNSNVDASYEPPGFTAASPESLGCFVREPTLLPFGSIRSLHHRMHCSVRSVLDVLEEQPYSACQRSMACLDDAACTQLGAPSRSERPPPPHHSRSDRARRVRAPAGHAHAGGCDGHVPRL